MFHKPSHIAIEKGHNAGLREQREVHVFLLINIILKKKNNANCVFHRTRKKYNKEKNFLEKCPLVFFWCEKKIFLIPPRHIRQDNNRANREEGGEGRKGRRGKGDWL